MNVLYLCILMGLHVNLLAQTSLLSKQQAYEDINQLVQTFEEVHYNPYFKISEQLFDQQKEKLLAEWDADSVSLRQFTRTGMQLTALMSGGHSYMDWQHPALIPAMMQHQFIPFMGQLDGNEHLIIDFSSESSLHQGQSVVSVNGIAVAELFANCMALIGGTDAFKKSTASKAFPLYSFFVEALKAPYTIRLKDSDTIIAVEGITLQQLVPMLQAPQVQQAYTYEVLQDSMALISYNKCENYEQFDLFLKKTFKTIQKSGIKKLIVDIRNNSGGASDLNDLLLAYITKKPYRQSSGRYWKVSQLAKEAYSNNEVYQRVFDEAFLQDYMQRPNGDTIATFSETLTYPVTPECFFEGLCCFLIGPQTFSSANFLADAVKTYKIATLIGQPTGEHTNDFGEQLSFDLLHSGSRVYVSSTYDIGADGDVKATHAVRPDIQAADALQAAIEWLQKAAIYKSL